MTPLNRDDEPFRGGGRALLVSLALAALGLVGLIVGLFVDGTQTAASYLAAYAYVVTVLTGLLAFVMATHTMNAAWPVPVRRLAEVGGATAPLVAVLALPLFWSLDRLYPWMHPERIANPVTRAIVLHKRPALNAPFFSVRVVVYVLLWALVAECLWRWSRRMDSPDAPSLKDRLRGFSSVLLPFVGLTATGAAFDWIMSRSPDFYSTMYGLYVLSGGFLAALGLLPVLVFFAQRAGYLGELRQSHWYAMGRLLFAFLIFWAYTGFFQYMLIWIGNKPIEARFYLDRMHRGDLGTSWFLIVGHFALPWLFLLSYWIKRTPATVIALGAWLLLCHYADIHWLVGSARPGEHPWRWQDLPALLFVGGLCVAFAIFRARGRLLVAYFDPDYRLGAAYESR